MCDRLSSIIEREGSLAEDFNFFLVFQAHTFMEV